MGVLKLDDLDPDGVHIVVDWGALQVGSSFFVPCLNTTAAKKQIKTAFSRRGWKMRVYNNVSPTQSARHRPIPAN
jgi:hypothetical protein